MDHWKLFLIALFILNFNCHKSAKGPSSVKADVVISDSVHHTSSSILNDSFQVLSQPIKKPLIPDYDTTLWTDMAYLDSSIVLDIRYATENNFVKEKMYECGRCFLRPEVAKVLKKIHKKLIVSDLGVKVFDCYRPLPIQSKLWEKVPDPRYVTDPKKGSMHNRGVAVDLTIIKSNGEELDMGTEFDYFGKEAYHTYTALSDTVLSNRKLLKGLMEAQGFKSIRTEWWHYSYIKKSYPLSEMVWNCNN